MGVPGGCFVLVLVLVLNIWDMLTCQGCKVLLQKKVCFLPVLLSVPNEKTLSN